MPRGGLATRRGLLGGDFVPLLATQSFAVIRGLIGGDCGRGLVGGEATGDMVARGDCRGEVGGDTMPERCTLIVPELDVRLASDGVTSMD